MIVTRKFVKGKWEPPFTPEEDAAHAKKFAEVCQAHAPPGTRGTERALMEGDVLNHGFNGAPMWYQEMMIRKAHGAGISTHGKVYKSGLADGRGAACPYAWVSGVEDVMTALRERKSVSCEGAVNYQPEGEFIAKPDVPLAEESIQEFANQYIVEDPKWAEKPQELREMVIDTHGAPAKGRGPKVKQRKNRDKPSVAVEIEGL